MEFDELLITTGVDALVRLVKEKQRIELEAAADVLNIPPDTLEDWARVLEEEGILRIEYRLTHVYLSWITPTEAEIEEERASFYEEKKDLEGEVQRFKSGLEKQTQDVQSLQKSFSEFYARAYGRIGHLEKLVAPIPAGKTISDDMFTKYQEELGGISDEMEEARRGLADIRDEIQSLGIEKGESESKQLIDRLEKTAEELHSLQDEMKELRKKASGQSMPSDISMPSMNDIKKKFNDMQKDFSALRTRNARMREDMISLQESSEILKSVAESVVGHEDKISALRKEMGELAEDAEKLSERSGRLSAKISEHAEMIERLGDSVNVSKGIIKRFPSQKKVMEELDRIAESQKDFEEKSDSLEKIIEAAGGRQVTAKQFAEIAKRMEAKAEAVHNDLDSLEAALEHEKGTYLTFQKIKERIVPSMDTYSRKLDEMGTRLDEIKKESLARMDTLKAESKELQNMMKSGQMQGLVKVAEEVRDKKAMLDEIRGALEGLVDTTNSLSKRITLLSREAKLLEIRGGGEGGAKTPEVEDKRKEIRHKLKLTQDEEKEFQRKRTELKKLIQSLWEE